VLLLFQSVPLIIRQYPGCRYACPGLCACWAFSPSLPKLCDGEKI